jgi:hypothetical protein
MNHALAIIQPSLFEGWSTVVEDVKAMNQHIIVSDLNVHRDQLGVQAFYFNPNNENEAIVAGYSCDGFGKYGNDPKTLQSEMGKVPGEGTRANWAGQTASGFRPYDLHTLTHTFVYIIDSNRRCKVPVHSVPRTVHRPNLEFESSTQLLKLSRRCH